jgi:hypothetical protein
MKETSNGNTIVVHASGKLTKEDYQRFVPVVERSVQKHGKINMLFEMHDFHGWYPRGLWEDIKFELKHFRDIERLAMVGESNWEKWMCKVWCPFTTSGESRYFDHTSAREARSWIQGKRAA